MMKRCRLGLDYESHFHLLGKGITKPRMALWCGLPCMRTAEAKKFAGSFILRVQQTVLIRLTNHFKLGDCLIITICPRKLTSIVFKGVGMQLSPRPKCTIDLLHDAQQCVQSSGLMQCNYCTTESGRVWHIWSCSCCY
jgi:hypothetical protein